MLIQEVITEMQRNMNKFYIRARDWEDFENKSSENRTQRKRYKVQWHSWE